VATHPVVLAGRITGEVPFSQSSFLGRHLMVHVLNRLVFPRILSVDTPMGRRARPGALAGHVPLIRVRSKDLGALGVRRVGRVVGVRSGFPLLEDDRTVEVGSVIWCTGYTPGFDWIKMPVFDGSGEPRHERGVVASMPGLFFVGLHFLTAMSSAMVHGVSKDAARIAEQVSAGVHDEATPDVENPTLERVEV
jgi:putative flavoprotein involved in K+ transport